jgi:hypothetical protein
VIWCRRRTQPKDSGAALILALGFVVLIGAVGGGLAGLATTSVHNQSTLELIRNREYAADGAIEQAISQVRGGTCTSPTPPIVDTLNNVAIRVEYVNACAFVPSTNGAQAEQRNVIFSAYCAVPSAATCNSTDVIIRAQVNFQQSPVKTYVQSWSVNR